jgi:hypothetical protein
MIDRVVQCEAGLRGGIRQVTTHARSTSGRGGERTLGYVSVETNMPTPLMANLVPSGIILSGACRQVRAGVALSPRGLVGGTAPPLVESVDCATTRRVFVRVIAEFRRPVTLRRTSQLGYPALIARGAVLEGRLAVRTDRGRTLVFARLLKTGKVQVSTAIPDACIPD